MNKIFPANVRMKGKFLESKKRLFLLLRDVVLTVLGVVVFLFLIHLPYQVYINIQEEILAKRIPYDKAGTKEAEVIILLGQPRSKSHLYSE